MSADTPKDRDEEPVPLNAEDLDIDELEDKILENVAGGESVALAACTTHCGNYIC